MMVLGGRLLLTLFGWAGLFWVLAKDLGAVDLATTLGVLILASGTATLLGAPLRDSEVQSRARRHDLGRVIPRWVIFLTCLAAAHSEDLLPFFDRDDFAVIGLAILSLSLALLKVADRSCQGAIPAAEWLGPVSATALLGISMAADLRADLALAVVVLVALALLAIKEGTVRRLRSRDGPPVRRPRDLAATFARGSDICLLPLFFAAPMVLPYLCARLLSGGVAACLDTLSDRAFKPLRAAYHGPSKGEFMSLAARLNLAFLLVGGGAAIAALTLSPFVAELAGLSGSALHHVLPWLLLAAVCPALFGAHDTLFAVAGRRGWLTALNIGQGGMVLAIAAAGAVKSAEGLATLYAISRLVQASLAAIILAWDSGVWPGPTALLLRRIKLF